MKKLTQQEFINKATAVHNSLYDYSEVMYINNKTSVQIKCSLHGVFSQSPMNHLKGQGCGKCTHAKAGIAKSTAASACFKEKADKVHNSKYNYNDIEYTSSSAKVRITCPKHGAFYQTPAMHLSGNGCPACAHTCKVPIADILQRFKNIHGDTYTYIFSSATPSVKDKVTITCSIHGEFTQRAQDHFNGQGCPKCKSSGFNIEAPAILYFIKLSGYDNLYKIGITNRSVKERFSNTELDGMDILLVKQFTNGKQCIDLETSILQQYSMCRSSKLALLKSGNTEILQLTHDQKDQIWTILSS